MKQLVFLLTLFITTTSFKPAIHPDDIIGVWIAGGGKGHIQIFKQNGKYYGKIIWLKNAKEANGEAKLDKKNPNPAMRNKPIIGTLLLKDFVYKNGEWTDGVIYDTTQGREFDAYIKMRNPNTLAVRGYIGFSMMGRTDVWTRLK
jgi:uncharacterized protein (DUF2147 family)